MFCRTAPETPNTTNLIHVTSSSSSSLTKLHPTNFVKKLASKLGIRTKFSSAPNISNTAGLESEVSAKSKENHTSRNSTNTILIGNSKFFKKLSKKEESGDIICNDEFDTISLDRVGILERVSVANRSNRSCPGFKVSLPNISENTELSDSRESLGESHDNNNCINNSKSSTNVEAINQHPKSDIFEPREPIYSNSRISNGSTASAVNECYESFEFSTNRSCTAQSEEPKPLPRYNLIKDNIPKTDSYENVVIEVKNPLPKPAARNNVNKPPVIEDIYENVIPKPPARSRPEPPKRTTVLLQEHNIVVDSSPSISRTSTLSSDSMFDEEANLEDILLSKKSKSFKHKKAVRTTSNKSDIQRSWSALSDSSGVTDASALDHVDCSDNKSMYASMTGTLPSKKADVPKRKVLFRHKTFTTIEIDKDLNILKGQNEFLKETLARYHIRGTGHCIYQAPTVKEFIYVFNRETLYNDDVEPFTKLPNRDSYYETAICFCKPAPPKFHKSAEDLLVIDNKENIETAKIDTLKLLNRVELNTTSFKCFCDDDSCKFHVKKRESPNSLVVKFSAINKSISTPDITLATTPVIDKKIFNSHTVPSVLEEPYAVVDILKDIPSQDIDGINSENTHCDSAPSTLSTSSSRPYSLKHIAEVLSLNEKSSTSDDSSLSSNALSEPLTRSCSQRQSSSSDLSQQSLKSCLSNNSTITNGSFKSCIEEFDSDDETLHSDDGVPSDSDTIKSDTSVTKRPWVHSDSFRFGSNNKAEGKDIVEESEEESSSSDELRDGSKVEVESLGLASLERGLGRDRVRSGSGRRRWDEAEGTSEGDALSVSSAASSSAPHHMAHHLEYSKVSVSFLFYFF